MDLSTPDDERTVDAFDRAIDDAGSVDELEEQRALAAIEHKMFQRPRGPIRLSRYLLLRPLGSGGAGVVYDGYDPELARRVAIKVLRPGRRDTEAAARARARFVREAQSIARLSHPNVIAVHDVGTYSTADLDPDALAQLGKRGRSGHDDGVFIVMEVVDGADASSWLERGDHGWREVLDVFLEAGRGLAAAHVAGIVHRDFKPGNVIVGKDGRVKVVDFGLALTYGASETSSSSAAAPVESASGGSAIVGELQQGPADLVESSAHDTGSGSIAMEKLTRTGALVGTPAYMAPEQHNGEPADQKADQFAFCASLFRALYGCYPFDARSVKSLYAAKIRHEVARVPDGSRVPAWLRRIVVRGLSPRPGDRFADMNALLHALWNDPARRGRRAARRAALPVAVGALAYTGWLLTRPGTVDVLVKRSGEPVPGAQVWIDDDPLTAEEEHVRGEVSAGLHRVRVTAPDHRPAETVVDVRRGGVHDLVVELQHEQGVFELDVDPRGASVFVDGVDFGSRLKNFRIDTGPHDILVRHEGYEDERLHWDARAEETRHGFVSLRQAMVWSRASSGSMPEATWVGDATGDGRDDLVHKRFHIISLYDPWSDVEHWRIELRRQAVVEICDADGDGVDDVVTFEWEDGTTRVSARSGQAGSERSPRLLWEASAVTGLSDDEVLAVGTAACLAREEGAPQVLVGGPWGERVVAYDGPTGRVLWERSVGEQVFDLAALHGAEGAHVAAVTANGVHAFGTDGRPAWSRALAVAPTESATGDKPWSQVLMERRSQGRAWTSGGELDGVPGEDLLVYAGLGERTRLVALAGADGTLLWERPATFESLERPFSRLDIDGDGALDLALASADGFDVVSGRSGRTRWGRSLKLPDDGVQLLAVSPAPVVAVVADGKLELLDALSGTAVAHVALPAGPSSPPAATDWDGDGRLDVVLGLASGEVHAWDARLRRLGAVPMPVAVTRIDPRRDGNHDGFPDLLVEANGPAVLVGPKVRWRRRYHQAVRAAPVVADLDADGELEVLAFAPDAAGEAVHLLDALTGTDRARQPMGGQVIRAAALLRTPAGFDAFALSHPILHRLRGRDLETIATFDVQSGWASPTVADTDGDGRAEVYVSSWEPASTLYALDAEDLALRWKRQMAHGSFAAPWVGDLDHDGEAEVVLSMLDGHLAALRASDGAPRWELQTGGRLNHPPAVGDVDGDGALELLVAPHVDTDDLVIVRATDGTELFRWAGLGSRRSRPLLHDADGDGRPEIYSGTRGRGIVRIGAGGEVRWQYGFGVHGSEQPGVSSPLTLADLEQDGRPAILAGFEDGSVHVVDPVLGRRVWAFHTGGGDVEGAPIAVDVDGDGVLEVLIGGHDRQLYCLRHRPLDR